MLWNVKRYRVNAWVSFPSLTHFIAIYTLISLYSEIKKKIWKPKISDSKNFDKGFSTCSTKEDNHKIKWGKSNSDVINGGWCEIRP